AGEGPWQARTGFRANQVGESAIMVEIAGRNYVSPPAAASVRAWSDGEVQVLFADGQAWAFGPPHFQARGAEGLGDGALIAPMPGMVTALPVVAGDKVSKGQILLVLEAMKMENGLAAPFDGRVAELNVRLGT